MAADHLLSISPLRRVPVYQNGLEQALRTFQHAKKISHVDVVAYHSLQSTTDVIDVVRAANLFSIYLLNEKAEFSRVNDQVECMGVVERSRTSLVIQLRDCFTGRDVFYFHDGKMVDATPPLGDMQ